MNTPIINLSVSQTLRAHFQTFEGLLSKTVSPERALVIQLEDFAAEIAKQREDTKTAWAEMAKYRHPETGDGQLKDLADRIARYIEEGQRDAAEMNAILAREAAGSSERGDKTRKAELQKELAKDSANVRSAEASQTTAQELFEQWLERYEKRNQRLEEMRAEYQALEKEGPVWIAQIRDAQKGEAADNEDAQKDGSVVKKSFNLRANLKSQAEMATLREQAGQAVDRDEEPSLDEEIAAREERQAQDDLISGWLQKTKKS